MSKEVHVTDWSKKQIGFSSSFKVTMLCIAVFVLGFFVGRESVYYQIKQGLGGLFGG